MAIKVIFKDGKLNQNTKIDIGHIVARSRNQYFRGGINTYISKITGKNTLKFSHIINRVGGFSQASELTKAQQMPIARAIVDERPDLVKSARVV